MSKEKIYEPDLNDIQEHVSDKRPDIEFVKSFYLKIAGTHAESFNIIECLNLYDSLQKQVVNMNEIERQKFLDSSARYVRQISHDDLEKNEAKFQKAESENNFIDFRKTTLNVRNVAANYETILWVIENLRDNKKISEEEIKDFYHDRFTGKGTI